MFITKLLGLYVYMEHSDELGSHNSILLDSGIIYTIKDEISLLERKMKEIERDNIYNISKIKEIANSNEQNIIKLPINVNRNAIKLQRYDNLIDQIFRLQMKQFSESISGIKKDFKTNRYLVQFDPSEQIENLNLNVEEYNHLIRFRDPFNSISVHDLFQEKTFSY